MDPVLSLQIEWISISGFINCLTKSANSPESTTHSRQHGVSLDRSEFDFSSKLTVYFCGFSNAGFDEKSVRADLNTI